jgi:uncharacterized RDD family membrane protein YckC
VTNDDSDLPEGPLDPFDDDVPLASGPDDVGFLQTPRVSVRLLSIFLDLFVSYSCIVVVDILLITLVLHPVKGTTITPEQNRTAFWLYKATVLGVAAAFILLERLSGRSIGKRMMRLRLVQVDGARPTWLRLILKYGVMFGILLVPFGPLVTLVGLAYAAVQPDRRSGFDLLAGTRVVSVPR